MRKLILAGITVLLVTFFVTCDILSFPGGEEAVEYTDVEYSEDGSAITVYLDGAKPVPVTKSQRAITTNLAKMAYDYIEVIFVHTDSGGVQTRARSSWELGQAAGISGVDRGDPGSGVDYAYDADNDGTNGKAIALMFVGRKDNKTLLGVGEILQVDREPKMIKVPTTGEYDWDTNGFPQPVGGASFNTTIFEDTTSVTFWIDSVKTGLLIKAEYKGGPTDIEQAVAYDSFTGEGKIRTGATRSAINNSRASYPLYPLPEPILEPPSSVNYGTGKEIKATYTFGGGAERYKSHIILEEDSMPVVEKRFPRYMDGGRYLAPQSNVDTETWVKVGSYGSDYKNVVPLEFTLQKLSYGLFSFYIEIPVYMVIRNNPLDLDSTKATNGGPDATMWKIRTGLGSELYSLDDGRSSGGCVLMGVGVSALDWLEIYWDFIQ